MKISDKDLKKCLDNLKGTQFLDAFCILDWIVKTDKDLQQSQKALNEVKDIIINHGETFDNKIHQDMQNNILEIIDKALGGNK